MEKTLIIIFMGLSFVGCKQESKVNGSDLGVACTMIGSDSSFVMETQTDDPLPENLAISFNGEAIDLDECNTDFFNSLKLNEERTSLKLYYSLNANPEDFEIYFPEGQWGEPDLKTVDMKIYSRNSCEDDLNLIEDLRNVKVEWEPVYANGKNCDVTSYKGTILVEE